MPKGKVGLALSSGGARVFAHIGVLTVLEKEGIPIDMIAGTSAGAFIGALYAQGKTATEIKNLIIDLVKHKISYTTQLLLAKTHLVQTRKAKNWFRSLIGDTEFKDLKIYFVCVATDIITGEEVVIKQGSVLKAVIASMSLPVIFKATEQHGRYLVDGGVVNPVPVSVLKDMGADFIIASNVIVKPADRVRNAQIETEVQKDNAKSEVPNIFSIMTQLVNITSYQTVKSSLNGADIVIRPNMADIGFTDYRKACECILRGELAAQDSMAEIKRLLSIDSALNQLSRV